MYRSLILRLLLVLLTPGMLTGCSGNAESEHADADTHDEQEGDHGDAEIVLTNAQAEATEIRVVPVQAQSLTIPLRVPARIVSTESGRAQVGALVAGRVSQLLASEGQSVARGTAMAAIVSPEVARLQGEYLRAAARADQADQQLDRSQLLAAEDLISETLLEQAVADARAAQADAAALAGEIRAHGGGVPSVTSDVHGRVVVRSPIAGVITERAAELGAFVEASASLYEVVAPGSVYADAEVPPDQAERLRPGTPAIILGPGGERFRGEVSFIGGELTGETRTATARLRVLNATAALRPETFVTVEFEGAVGREALVVLASAIEREGADTFVYVPDEQRTNTFRRVPVQLGEAFGDLIEVTGGLESGDRIVADGVFALKSFRQRGELTEHEH